MPDTRIKLLFERFLAGNCTANEKQELAEWVLNKEQEELLANLLEKAWANVESLEKEMPKEKIEDIFRSIVNSKTENSAPVHSIRFRRLKWWAAASVLLLLGLSSYLLFIKESPSQVEIAKNDRPKQDVKAPETNRATITLADGTTVYLDSANNGQLAQVGNVNLVKLDNGQIAYEYAEEASAPLSSRRGVGGEVHNTLYNPRGSQVIDITLSDGSRVWLNAGSSITYPVAFIGEERKVEIQGEGYFEVETNKAIPFKVGLGEDRGEVVVLGTHFNINAYEDEEDIKVTLLEGSVRLTHKAESKMLSPGQQGIIKPSALSLNPSPSIDEVMSWKEGRFTFSSVDIKTIMRQAARWYNVDIEYKGKLEGKLSGGISRAVNLSQFLHMLALTDKVKFEIQGSKVVVQPK